MDRSPQRWCLRSDVGTAPLQRFRHGRAGNAVLSSALAYADSATDQPDRARGLSELAGRSQLIGLADLQSSAGVGLLSVTAVIAVSGWGDGQRSA